MIMKQIIKECLWPSIIALLLGCISCKKYLDEKPDKKLVVPSTLRDAQALLDNLNYVWQLEPTVGEFSADNFYLTTSTYQSSVLMESERRAYTWQKDYIMEPTDNDWSNAYRKVYYVNTVLEGLQN